VNQTIPAGLRSQKLEGLASECLFSLSDLWNYPNTSYPQLWCELWRLLGSIVCSNAESDQCVGLYLGPASAGVDASSKNNQCNVQDV